MLLPMLSDFKTFALLSLIFFGSCSNKETIDAATNDATIQNHALLQDTGTKVFILARDKQCWPCVRIYFELFNLTKKRKDIQFVMLSRKLSEGSRKRFHKTVNYQWSDNFVHHEDTELLDYMINNSSNKEILVLLIKDGVWRYFKGTDDTDDFLASLNK